MLLSEAWNWPDGVVKTEMRVGTVVHLADDLPLTFFRLFHRLCKLQVQRLNFVMEIATAAAGHYFQ